MTTTELMVALSALVEPGNRELGELLRRVSPAEAVDRIGRGGVSGRLAGAAETRLGGPVEPAAVRAFGARLLAEATRLGVRVICPGDDEWPAQVHHLVRISRDNTGFPVDRDTDPPLAIWIRGPHRLDEALARSVAVVGARAASEYGAYVATDLAHGLAERGWTVVSGGALGIDGAAHRAALAAGGCTVAVLACGVDRPYPVAHTNLFEQIGEEGLVISEWPPDSQPYRQRFLIRNRLIAAASAGTVMVEAALRSGARQTLRRARMLGRPALVVPGPVTSAMSVGCHELVRGSDEEAAARLVTCAAHVVEAVGGIGADLAPPAERPATPRDGLTDLARRVLDACPVRTGVAPERLAAIAGCHVLDVLRVLPALELADLVQWTGTGWRLAPPPKKRRVEATAG